jgi:outer membrane protein assembly factor BamB
MKRSVAVAVLVSTMLSGCSFFRSDTGPKMAPVPTLASSVQLRTLWSARIGRGGDAVLSPAVASGSVYAAARDGTVVRLDAATGRELWRAQTGQTLSGGVGAGGEVVTVGTSEGEVIALDASDGSMRWRARVSSEVLAAPTVSGDVVVVRCSDSRVFALDARDGKRRWVYQRAMPALTVRSPAGTVVQGQTVYAGFAGGRLAALALNNGGVRWEAPVALQRGATELERVADVVGLPWVSDREACAVAYQGRVACFDAANGQPLWSRELSSVSGLGVDARYLFVSDDRGGVHALDRSNGTSFWKQDKLFLRRLTAPLPLGKEIAVGDVEGYVHLLSRDSGDFIGRAATDGTDIAAPPVAMTGGFVVQTRGGTIYAFAAPGS